MSDFFVILSLVIAGIALIIAEIILIPGTTIFGILGFILFSAGVYLGFTYFGEAEGWYITGGSIVLLGLSIYFSFKSKAWQYFALKGSIDSKVNEGLSDGLSLGDRGIAVSTLKPIGKGDFNGEEFEIRSLGEYVEAGTSIEIIKIEANTIIVKTVD